MTFGVPEMYILIAAGAAFIGGYVTSELVKVLNDAYHRRKARTRNEIRQFGRKLTRKERKAYKEATCISLRTSVGTSASPVRARTPSGSRAGGGGGGSGMRGVGAPVYGGGYGGYSPPAPAYPGEPYTPTEGGILAGARSAL